MRDESAYSVAKNLMSKRNEPKVSTRQDLNEAEAPEWWGEIQVQADPSNKDLGDAIEKILRNSGAPWDDLEGDTGTDSWIMRVHPTHIHKVLDSIRDSGFDAHITDEGGVEPDEASGSAGSIVAPDKGRSPKFV